MKKDFTYIVQDGKPPLEVSQELRDIHKKYSGKQLTLTISNERKRTNPQNNWFHHVNKLIADFMRAYKKEHGDENYYKVNEETTKLWIKQEFLGYTEDEKHERHLRKTSNLKTFEMNELWQQLQVFFSPFGLNIPDPNQKDFLE
jgi:hypothetical protein